MKHTLGALCLAILAPVGASPQATTNEVYVLAAVAGQANYKLQTVRIDAPLTLTIDSLGVLHLGLAASSLSTITAGDLVTASAPVP